jgi:class 3 adenylate cyclase
MILRRALAFPMSNEPSAAERRLAAILVADVSGYSRLVHEDEAATVARLAALRRQIDDTLAEHGGRVVSSAGDGFLADFGSALDAVAAALEIQRRLEEGQRDTPEAQRLLFRIGLNLGDVLEQQDDLFGDAINVAARIQELAPPGGICASRSLRDSVRGRFPCDFERIGKRQVKNIARPVTVYHLLTPGTRRPIGWVPVATATALIVVIGAAALWASLSAHHVEPTTPPPAATQQPRPAPPPAETTTHPEAPGRSAEPKPRQSIEGTAGDADSPGRQNSGGR